MESGDLALVALFLIALVLVGGMFYFVYKYTKVQRKCLRRKLRQQTTSEMRMGRTYRLLRHLGPLQA